MPQPYTKPWLSFPLQLALLQSRGLVVTDQALALDHLERIGYYRLSGYFYPFRKHYRDAQGNLPVGVDPTHADDFVENTHFCDAVNLYIFDKKLRLLVSDALERVEVALRVDVAYTLSKKNPCAHKESTLLHPRNALVIDSKTRKTKHQTWLDNFSRLYDRANDDFVAHFKQKYSSDMPIWIAAELLDFGALSHLFNIMTSKEQTAIAVKYDLDSSDFIVLANWFHGLNFLRNIAAHHSRLWNRTLVITARLPKNLAPSMNWVSSFDHNTVNRIVMSLFILAHLTKKISPNTSWHQRMWDHLETFPVQHSDKKFEFWSDDLKDQWKKHWLED